MAGKEKFMAVVDMGTSSISLVIAALGPGEVYKIVACNELPSIGVDKGVIKDAHSAASVVTALFDGAERECGVGPAFIYAGYSGMALLQERESCSNEIEPGREEKGDLTALMEGEELKGYEVLHSLPAANRTARVRAATAGTRGEADRQLILVKTEHVRALKETFRLAGRHLSGVVFTPLVEALFMTDKVERDLGCVVIDLGAGTTKIVGFRHGMLTGLGILPVGMEHVSSDLAVGLRTTKAFASKLYQDFVTGEGGLPDVMEVEGLNGNFTAHEKSTLRSIIEARWQEICELVKISINSFGFEGFVTGGVKLTGGGSQVSGLVELLSRQVEPVKESLNHIVSGSEKCRISLAGLLHHFYREGESRKQPGGGNILYKLQNMAGNLLMRRRGRRG